MRELYQKADKLGLICMHGCEDMGTRINEHLKKWDIENGGTGESCLIKTQCPRFATGEAKGVIEQTIRGYDIYILCDPFNYGESYNMYGTTHRMSPDDHFQDLCRIVAACGGKARRVTVIMPMLYEGRQHRRTARESLDCALSLQLLEHMGVNNIITFDAHDARVQNAIPLSGFEDMHPPYQMIRALLHEYDDIYIDREHTMIVSPDEGGMARCIYYAEVLDLDLGMFYKRRDYGQVQDGRNRILSHEFLGEPLGGKDVIVVDDMIASGESILSISKILKEHGARRIFVFTAFGLFSGGLDAFDQAYKQGDIEKIFTTDLIYHQSDLIGDPEAGIPPRPWHCLVDMSKFVAWVVEHLHHEKSLSELLSSRSRIARVLKSYEDKRENGGIQ